MSTQLTELAETSEFYTVQLEALTRLTLESDLAKLHDFITNQPRAINRDRLLDFRDSLKRSSTTRPQCDLGKFCIAFQKRSKSARIAKEGEIVGLLLFTHIPRERGQLNTEWLKLDWAVCPSAVNDSIKFSQTHAFQAFLAEVFGYFGDNCAYAYGEFPEQPGLKKLAKAETKTSPFSSSFRVPYDVKKSPTTIGMESTFQSKIAFQWENPAFDSMNAPQDLVEAWGSAQKAYRRFKSGINPFGKSLEILWLELYQRVQFRQLHQPNIRKRLLALKLGFQNLSHAPGYPGTVSAFLENHGLEYIILDTADSKSLEFLARHQKDLLIDLIESIPTQGSLFNKITVEGGDTLVDLFKIETLQEFFKGLLGLFVLRNTPVGDICLGYATAHYKKDCSSYSKQLMCGIVISEPYRGYSLGKMITMGGMIRLLSKCDIYYEDATQFNNRTKKMVTALAFHNFGILKNIMYAPHPTTREIIAVDLHRRYWVNPSFLKTQRKLKKQLMQREVAG